jgi:hypothetical protein
MSDPLRQTLSATQTPELPEGPWILDWVNGEHLCIWSAANILLAETHRPDIAHAIAAIPDMLAEIETLQERSRLFERALATIAEKDKLIEEMAADIRALQYELQGSES